MKKTRFTETQIVGILKEADSGFHKEENMKMLMEEGIDGYVADPQFRKRDPRFAEVDKYKDRRCQVYTGC